VNIIHNLDSGDGSAIKVIHLRYADAKKIAQIVQSLQSANSSQGRVNNVSIVSDEENNSLLVSGNGTNRDRAISLIKQMDTKNASGGNNTVVIHLNYLTAKKLAPMLTKLAHGFVEQQKKAHASSSFGVGASNASVSIQPELNDNAIVMSGPHSVIQNLKGIIKKLDLRPQEVLVQAIIVKVDESKMNQFGIQWGMTQPKGFNPGGGSTPMNYDPNSSGYMPNMGGALQQAFTAGVGYISYGRLQAIVTALNKSGNADILATPSVLVLNNQKAGISDGKNVGMANRTYSGSASGSNPGGDQQPFNSVERKDVTLSLEVTPQIAPDNTVRLEIKQKNDSLDASANSQDPENPTINTSKINTSVLVNSGDVLVLGGLISDDTEENVSKVPILGDIPLLGKLFQNKTKTVEKKNLMVFIRPIIINNRKQANKVTSNRYNYMRYQEQRKQAGLGLDKSGVYPVLPGHKAAAGPKLPSPFSENNEK
jgi:general secretion pathway protein D